MESKNFEGRLEIVRDIRRINISVPQVGRVHIIHLPPCKGYTQV